MLRRSFLELFSLPFFSASNKKEQKEMTDNEMAQFILQSIIDGCVSISWALNNPLDIYCFFCWHDKKKLPNKISKNKIMTKHNGAIENKNGILIFQIDKYCLCVFKVIHINDVSYLRGDNGKWREWTEYNQLKKENKNESV